MADLLIKPLTGAGNTVTIQDQAGGAILTTADSGATLTNATITSPTITSPTITSPAGIGLARTDGTLHVHTASAGTVAASAQADDLVIENSVEGGMTILTPDAQSARIRFSSPSTASGDVGGASILYRQNINKMVLGTEVSGGVLGLKSGAGVERMTIDASGYVTKPNQPAFMAYHDPGDVNYTSTINVDNTHFNTGNHYNTSNSTFTAPIAGKYLFTIQMNANWNTAVPRAYWQINNANVGNGIHLRGSDSSHDGLEMRSYTVILNLSASDAVRIWINVDRFDMFGANSFSGCLLH